MDGANPGGFNFGNILQRLLPMLMQAAQSNPQVAELLRSLGIQMPPRNPAMSASSGPARAFENRSAGPSLVPPRNPGMSASSGPQRTFENRPIFAPPVGPAMSKPFGPGPVFNPNQPVPHQPPQQPWMQPPPPPSPPDPYADFLKQRNPNEQWGPTIGGFSVGGF